MSDTEFIKYLIHEDIYVVNEGDSTLEKEEQTYLPTVAETEVEQEQKVEVNYKKIVVIVEDSTSETLNKKDHDYLAKILASVKIEVSDIALINVNNEAMANLNNVQKIIALTPNHQLDFSNPLYEPSKYQKADIVLADPLSEIASSVEFRKKLWEALKVMFN